MTNQPTIPYLVLGATGKIGSELIAEFDNNGISVKAVSRKEHPASAGKNIHWVQADLEDGSNLDEALHGTKSVFLVLPFSNHLLQLEERLLQAAKSAGVQHVVKISSMSASLQSEFPISKLHALTEEQLKSSGLSWTILRPTGFMQNWLWSLAPAIIKERKIYAAAGKGTVPWIDVRDIAAVAYATLLDPLAHSGKTYELTGEQSLDYYQVASALGTAIGTPVTYVEQTIAEARNYLEQSGTPAWAIDLNLRLMEAQRLNQNPPPTKTVEDILGKRPIAVEGFARDYAGSFR
jgi:uncharacterized protein YbjT (DUF2867 family)